MNPWKDKGYKHYYSDKNTRKGIRFRFESGIDNTLRLFMSDFTRWIRANYCFPIRVNVYIKNSMFIKAKDGSFVSATFFGPFDRLSEPYIKISAGDFSVFSAEKGIFNALCGEIGSVAHELTHYFQWINN